MQKKIIFLPLLMAGALSHAQVTIQNGALVFIQPGATVHIQGDISSQSDLQGAGTVVLDGSTLQHIDMNGFVIPDLEESNAGNATLSSNAHITGSLAFLDGKLQLNTFNLVLDGTAALSGVGVSSYFITNQTGELVRAALGTSAFVFPIGYDGTHYDPLTLTQNGTVHDIGVRAMPNVLYNGSSGSPFVKEVVNTSWQVTDASPGADNLSMTAAWNAADELSGFDRTRAGISFYDGTGWDMMNTMTGAASGAGPFTFSRSSLTSAGVFAVGTRPVLTTLLVSPKIFLQAPYSAATGMMADGLRAASLIPLSEPYSGMTFSGSAIFAQSGSGGGETIPSSFLSATGTGSDIVDWVFAQLHRSSDGVVVGTRSVLVQRDGTVVDVDGTNSRTPYVNFAGFPAGSYFISIRHRNHLGIRTATVFSLARTTTTAMDFTGSVTQAFNGSVSNSAMATLAPGVFGLWAGNVNGNANVRYTGPLNDQGALLNTCLRGNIGTTLTNVYSPCDLNMDGRIKYTGPLNDQGFLLNTILGGVINTILFQPF